MLASRRAYTLGTTSTDAPDWETRISTVGAFLDERLSSLRAAGLTASWLESNDCRLRIYISLFSGDQAGDILLSNRVLAGWIESGAELRLDAR